LQAQRFADPQRCRVHEQDEVAKLPPLLFGSDVRRVIDPRACHVEQMLPFVLRQPRLWIRFVRPDDVRAGEHRTDAITPRATAYLRI
jgi:hypothetical protein